MAAYLPHLIVAVVLLSFFTSLTRTQTDESHILLLPYLDRIEAKLEELDGTVASLRSNGGCGCTRSAPGSAIADADLGRPQKRETKEETLAARDSHLFHINRLADKYLNSIPASSWHNQHQAPSGVQDQDDQQQQQLSQTTATQSERRLLLALGQLHESMLGDAFDSMNLILKQQLTSFKSTLIKLSNRLVDHNYQHHVLAEQMSLVRDECSLVAGADISRSQQNNPSNLSGSGDLTTSARHEQTTTTLEQQQQALRSSDAIFIRRLSDELSQSFHKSLASASGSGLAICKVSSDVILDEQERHLRQDLSASLSVELKQFQRRVDEIDSVVKQSALLLSKLVTAASNGDHRLTASSCARHATDHDQTSSSSTSQAATTLTFTNLAPADTNENWPLGNASHTSSGKSSSRWFAGSKVPNQRRASSVVYVEPNAARFDTPLAGPVKCQTKTSLTKPADCRQLREAGANCSGQYYIFTRGSTNNSIRHVLCDMNSEPADEGGGWTLVMRRIDKSLVPIPSGGGGGPRSSWQFQQHETMSALKTRTTWLDEIYSSQVDFNQDWASYKGGFGALERWWEFFIGLDLLHQLTRPSQDHSNSMRTELQIDLVGNNSQELHLKFEDLRVANESEQYELHVGSCNHSSSTQHDNLCAPVTRLNMTRFFTQDKLVANNCSLPSPGLPGGWWLLPAANETHCASLDHGGQAGLRLTSPIGRSTAEPNGRAQHLYWPGWPPGAPEQPLRQVVLKVRQRRRWRASRPAASGESEAPSAQ